MKRIAPYFLLVLIIITGSTSIVMAQTTTVGNNSYIQLGSEFENPKSQSAIVLNALKEFEDQNQGLEILSWVIHGTTFIKGGHLHGIWVHHRLKQQKYSPW